MRNGATAPLCDTIQTPENLEEGGGFRCRARKKEAT
jgi:hypothetical protein